MSLKMKTSVAKAKAGLKELQGYTREIYINPNLEIELNQGRRFEALANLREAQAPGEGPNEGLHSQM